MTLRVALVIDGQQSGAKKALDDTAAGIRTVKSAAAEAAGQMDRGFATAGQSAGGMAVAITGVGREAEQAATKIQAMINAAVGIGSGPANQSIREWTGALAMQGRSLDELRGKYNPLFAAEEAYKSNLTEIRTLHAQGVLSTDEMTAAISRQKQALAASIDVIKGRNKAIEQGNGVSAAQRNFAAANVGFQLQDIFTTAPFMSATTVGLQQGPQLAAAFQGQTLKQTGATLAAAAASILSPVSLVTIGLTTATAAAIQYFTTAESGADKAKAKLDEQNETIRKAAAYWGDVVPAFKQYVDLQERANRINAGQEAANTLAGQQLQGLGGNLVDRNKEFTGAVRSLGQIDADPAAIKAFTAAFVDLRQKLDDGTASTYDVGKANVELAETVKNYGTKEVLAFQKVWDDLTASIFRNVAAAGEAQKAWIRALAGGDNVQDIIENNRVTIDGRPYPAAAFTPRNPGVPSERPNRELNGEDDPVKDAQDARKRSLDQTLASQRLQLSLIGQTVSETERLRLEQQFVAQVEEDAARRHAQADPAEIAAIKEKAAEYGKLAEQIAATNALREHDRTIERLQAELGLVGATETARRRSLALLQEEQRIQDLGITSTSALAEQMRTKALRESEMANELRKETEAWGKVQRAGEDAIDGIVDSLGKGDFKGALDSVKDAITGFASDEIKSSLKNGLMGTDYGTAGDIGGITGIFGRLFGDRDAAVNAVAGQTVGTMTVTAATVSINGAPLGLPGSVPGATVPGLAAGNDNAISKYAAAIKSIESGGRYDALGPFTKSGDRAYGAYQVMGDNIGPWTEGALGRRLSPSQFLADPDAQDAVFAKYFGDAAGKYGASGAANWWFTGRANSSGRADVLGTTDTAYVAKFNQALGGAAQNLDTFGQGVGSLGQSLPRLLGGGQSSSLLGSLGSLFGGISPTSSFWAPNTTLDGFLRGYRVGGWSGDDAEDAVTGVVHGREFVVKAPVVAKPGVRKFLQALNDDRVTGFRSGGYGDGSRISDGSSTAPSGNTYVYNDYTSGGVRVEHEQQQDGRGGRQDSFAFYDTVGTAIGAKGGGASRALQRNYDVRRRGIDR